MIKFSDPVQKIHHGSKIILGDTFEKMNEIEDESVDLIICDLPYRIIMNKSQIGEIWKHYKRIISYRGSILLFGRGRCFASLVNSNPEWFRYDLVWDKGLCPIFIECKNKPFYSHEQIAVFQKHPSKTMFNKGFQNLHNSLKIEEHPTSILKFSDQAFIKGDKSLGLLEYLVRSYSTQGGLVLDNTCGSGAVAEVCERLDRFFICIDKNPKCIETVKRRVLPLFEKRVRGFKNKVKNIT